MSRLTIEPKRLREPQEGGQSREENRDIRLKVDIKISRCSAGGSAPALGKKRERCRWQKKRTFLGAAVGMSRLTIEPKRLREPQEGGQSREENRDIRLKVDIKISRCSAGGSAPALGKKRERCRWQKKRTFLGAAVGMSRLTIEPKRLREPQEGGQSREENRDIRLKVDIKISRCSAGGSAPALGAGCRRFESCHLDHNRTPILIQCVS